MCVCFSERPSFTEKPEGVSVVRAGGRTVFECRVAGTPEISVRWFRDGAEIHQSVKHKMWFVDSVASLEICDVGEQDTGKYFCEARNDAGTESCPVELEVKGWFCLFMSSHHLNMEVVFSVLVAESLIDFVISEPPLFVEELTSLQVVKGSTATFACRVAGSSPFNIAWFKDKKQIKSSQRYIITDGDKVGLIIQGCGAEDVGTYQCIVANEVGSCTDSVALSLKGWFD